MAYMKMSATRKSVKVSNKVGARVRTVVDGMRRAHLQSTVQSILKAVDAYDPPGSHGLDQLSHPKINKGSSGWGSSG